MATAEDSVHCDTSIFGFLWRSAEFLPSIVDPRRVKWDAQALWRGERQAKKRGRRRERKEREREAAAREMEAIEQHQKAYAATDAAERERLENEARHQAVVETAAATIQRCFRQHLANLECERARLVPTVLNLCVRLLGGTTSQSQSHRGGHAAGFVLCVLALALALCCGAQTPRRARRPWTPPLRRELRP